MKRYFSLISLMLVVAGALTLTSCLSDGDDTIVLEEGNTSGIPSDDSASPNPEIGSSTTTIPNIQYTVEKEGKDAIVRIDMTGVQNADGDDWMRLVGTGQQGQNVWIEVDGKPKGIIVANSSDSQAEERAKVDLVFCVDNSGSMSEEADAIARDITSWAELLENSGIDIRFGCVGYSVSGTINGAINLTTAAELSAYLDRSTGTSRTMGYSGTDAYELRSAANAFGTSYDECGAMAILYGDANMNFRTGSNRIYVNFTDEPNQPGGNMTWSTQFFKSQDNWSTVQGTVHTVYSASPSFTETIGRDEYPWTISEYTGGTVLYASSSFTGVTLSSLPVTGAMQNSYVIRFTNVANLFDGLQHEVKITILSSDGKTKAERTFYIVFG